jgi:hypothetical protein
VRFGEAVKRHDTPSRQEFGSPDPFPNWWNFQCRSGLEAMFQFRRRKFKWRSIQRMSIIIKRRLTTTPRRIIITKLGITTHAASTTTRRSTQRLLMRTVSKLINTPRLATLKLTNNEAD